MASSILSGTSDTDFVDRKSWTKLSEKIAAPTLAAIFCVGAALAATGDHVGDAYGKPTESVSRSEAAAGAASKFYRSDLDRSGDLSVDETVALAVASSTLAKINGFVVVGLKGDTPKTTPVAKKETGDAASHSYFAERARLEAIAIRDFHVASGPDGVLEFDDFIAFELERFDNADTDGNGVLEKTELAAYSDALSGRPASLSS
ncbi:MAG: hypothetical protein AAF742_06075 [Pseudomonadota bacterium]